LHDSFVNNSVTLVLTVFQQMLNCLRVNISAVCISSLWSAHCSVQCVQCAMSQINPVLILFQWTR